MVQPVSTSEPFAAGAPQPPALSPRHAELLSSLLILDHNLARFTAENSLSATDLLAFFRDPAIQSALADLHAAAIDLDAQHSLRLRRRSLDALEHILDTTDDPDKRHRAATTLARVTRPLRASRNTAPLANGALHSNRQSEIRNPQSLSSPQSPIRNPQSPPSCSTPRQLFDFLCQVFPQAHNIEALDALAPHLSLDLVVNGNPPSRRIEDDLAPLLHDAQIVQVRSSHDLITGSSASARIHCLGPRGRPSISYTVTAAPTGASPPAWLLTSITRHDHPNTS